MIHVLNVHSAYMVGVNLHIQYNKEWNKKEWKSDMKQDFEKVLAKVENLRYAVNYSNGYLVYSMQMELLANVRCWWTLNV